MVQCQIGFVKSLIFSFPQHVTIRSGIHSNRSVSVFSIAFASHKAHLIPDSLKV